MSTAPIVQPSFDSRISTLAFPLSGNQYGNIQRGFMVWDWSQPIGNYSAPAYVHFLYNPSDISADYMLSPNLSVASSVLFPTAYNATNLRVPLQQSVEWSLLFDRTYELWGNYDSSGQPVTSTGDNDPSVIGVLADIQAMQQFTGMFLSYSTGNSNVTTPESGVIAGWQGIMTLIPSYVYFGGLSSYNSSAWYYGYISEWDVTITDWTQYMVPKRCVINITWTMLPPNTSSSSSNVDTRKVSTGSPTPGENSTAVLYPGSLGIGGN